MKIGAKIVITKGRLKGERGIVIGTSDLNMEHKIVIRREKGRNKIMGFRRDELELQ